MRKIKFRGRKDTGEWVYGYYGHKEASDQHFIMVETMNLHHDWTYFTDYEVDPETVGQYTGLKDKNGKEIYESDLIQHMDPVTLEMLTSEVYWNEKGYWAVRDKNGKFVDLLHRTELPEGVCGVSRRDRPIM